jgi:hypothetical protein
MGLKPTEMKGSEMNKDTAIGVYGYSTRHKHSFSFMQYISVFQAEVYAIKASMAENLRTIEIETSIFSQIVKLQLKLFATTGSPQNWSGTAINPSCNC